MGHISLTIPSDDQKALVAGATMLLTLADKLPGIELDDLGGGAQITGADPAPPVSDEAARKWAQSNPPVTGTTDCTLVMNDHFEGGIEAAVCGKPSPEPREEGPATTADVCPGPELDADGLPWDRRIHASTKTKTQDERWKKRRGVDAEDYDRVVAELRQLMAADGGTVDAAVVPPPPPAAEVPAPAAPVVPPPPPPPPAAAPEAEAPQTFAEFLKAVAQRIQAKQTDMPTVNGILQQHGVANMQLVGSRTDLIPALWAAIVQGGA